LALRQTIGVPAVSTFLLIPLNDQGAFQDRIIAPVLQDATSRPAQFSDLFLFSHGWWTNANAAMVDYDRFIAGFTRCILSDAYALPFAAPVLGNYLAAGLHWPSVLTEDRVSVLNYAEALTFFTMRARADTVGSNGAYATLNVALRSQTVRTFHLIGHSFGCRVVCSALQKLLVSDVNSLDGIDVRVLLLEPAFDQEDLEPDQPGAPPHRYGLVLKNPNVRMLITRSDHDLALSLGYPLANVIGDVVNHPGGGAVAGVARQLVTHLAGGAVGGMAQAVGTIVGHMLDVCHAVNPGAQVDAGALTGSVESIVQQGDPKELTAARFLLHALRTADVDVALAAGGAGLRPPFIQQLGARHVQLPVGPGWDGPPAGTAAAPRCVVTADLSDLHARPGGATPPWNDHHSDIYLLEVYRLAAWFLFSNRGPLPLGPLRGERAPEQQAPAPSS